MMTTRGRWQGIVKKVVVGGGWGGVFFFQAEDGIRDLVRSRGLGDVYKRQLEIRSLRRLTATLLCRRLL